MTETSLIGQEQFVGVAKREAFWLLGLWLREEPEQKVDSRCYGSIQSGGSMMGRGAAAAAAAASMALSVAIRPVGGIVGRNEGRGQWIEGGA